MARLITVAGDLAPPYASTDKLTFKFDANDPDALNLFPLEGYPWSYSTKLSNNSVPGTVPTQLMDKSGIWTDVYQEPYGIGDQVVINNELQYYVRQHEVDAFNLPVMKELGNGELSMYCHQTPDNFKDVAITGVDRFGDFPVIDVDENARTITVSGLKYERKRPSDEGTYERGSYTGFDRAMRDELTSDSVSYDGSTKRRKYDYGWIRLQPNSGDFRKVKYDYVEDFPAKDIKREWSADSTHVIRIQDGQLSSTDWANISNGGVIKLYRRLPWIAPMLATGGGFSQKYWIVDTVMKIDNHAEQFFALWGWGNYCKLYTNDSRFTDENGDELYDFDEKYTGATELDMLEWPGGGDWYTKYHNIHAPEIGGMYNYAVNNGIEPVMDNAIGLEWDTDTQAGHIIAIPRNTQGFVDYGEYFHLRVEWLPPWHPRNQRKIGIVNYYAGPENGELRFLCGCITPPWWDENPGLAKQIFLNNAVGGNFVNDNEFVYAEGHQSTRRDDTIVNKLKWLEVRQVAGQYAGGAGYPDFNGEFSRGWLPTPFDQTGGSGSGRVANDGSVTPPNNGGGGGGSTDDPDDVGDLTPVDRNRARIRILLNNPEINNSDGGSINDQQVNNLINEALGTLPKVRHHIVDYATLTLISIFKPETPFVSEITALKGALGVNAGDTLTYVTKAGGRIDYEFYYDDAGLLTARQTTERVSYTTIPSWYDFRTGIEAKVELNISGTRTTGHIGNFTFIEDA